MKNLLLLFVFSTVLTLSSYEPFLVFKKGRDASSGYDYFKIKCENYGSVDI